MEMNENAPCVVVVVVNPFYSLPMVFMNMHEALINFAVASVMFAMLQLFSCE